MSSIPEASASEGHSAGSHSAETRSAETQSAGTHCQQAAIVSEDSAAGPRTLSSIAADCCALSEVPPPETPAVPVIVASYDVTLESSGRLDEPSARPFEIKDHRQEPPQLAPQPLYTLHSVFLI